MLYHLPLLVAIGVAAGVALYYFLTEDNIPNRPHSSNQSIRYERAQQVRSVSHSSNQSIRYERAQQVRSVPHSSNQSIRYERAQQVRSVRYRVRSSEYCSICTEDLLQCEDGVKTLRCGHKFHDACILPWIGRENTCPNCRERL